MPKQIKPVVKEISLAFNPANMKKFHMYKEHQTKGGKLMEKAVAVLNSEDKLFKEVEFKAFMDPLKLSKDNQEYLTGAYKLLSMAKDDLPDDFAEKLVAAVPELPLTFTKEVEVKVDEAPIVARLTKEIEEKLRKELEITETDALKLMKDEVASLKKDLGEAQEALTKEQDARLYSEILTSVKENGYPGDPEKVAKTLLMATKVNPEMAKDMEETLAGAAEMVKAAGVFTEHGSSGGGSPSNALKKIQDKVAELKKDNPDIVDAKAWEQVMRDNPALYKEYTDEQREKGGTH